MAFNTTLFFSFMSYAQPFFFFQFFSLILVSKISVMRRLFISIDITYVLVMCSPLVNM